MSAGLILNEEKLSHNRSNIFQIFSESGITEAVNFTIAEKILLLPYGLSLDIQESLRKKQNYSIFYSHELWGNANMYCGDGKLKEYLLHTDDNLEQVHYILRRIVNNVNASLSQLVLSADLILAQFSRDEQFLNIIASTGDKAAVDLLMKNPNVSDDLKVMIQLRK